MLIRSELDLNSVRNCTDSIKHRLKQTMLNQELVFMRQVYELHRLHRIQTAMMEDFEQKGMDSYNLHTRCVNSISIGPNNHATRSMAGFTLSNDFSSQHRWHRLHCLTQKPLDLQLSADEFISCSADDFIGKGVLGCSLKEPLSTGNTSRGRVIDLDDLKLSLSTGGDAAKKSGYCKAWIGTKSGPSSSEIIDLENPNLVFSDNAAYLGRTSGFSAQNISSLHEHMLERVSQMSMRDNPSGTPLANSVVDMHPIYPRITSSDAGLNGYGREFVSADHWRRNQTSGTCVSGSPYLNMVKVEDSSCFTVDHSVTVHPPRSSPSCLRPTSQKANVNHCTKTRDMPRQLDLNVDLAVSYGDQVSVIDLDSDSGEDLCSSRSDQKVESVGSLSKLSNGLLCDIRTVEVRMESNIERDAESPVLLRSSRNREAANELNCHEFCSSSESDCVGPRSSSVKTMQSSVVCRDLNMCTDDESQKAEVAHIGEQDQRSSESSESNILHGHITSQEADVDELVQKAAESLLHISLQSQQVVLKEFQSEEDDQPQCSSDSFAEMVLNAKESNPDDYCVSSNAFVVDESEKKENRHKLKRGTRMKDFQKDILPGLSILSRHEICEDINILEGVIRSREYKKMRAKFGDRSDWSRPTRSKRSRVRGSRR
uniref:Uncharacterized protein n=1 Tax=Opuntia streptacantha TaxID=393608 RepID=A0A7C9ARI2_OPUST